MQFEPLKLNASPLHKGALPVKVTADPEHTGLGETVYTGTDGDTFNVSIVVAVLEQPNPLVTV